MDYILIANESVEDYRHRKKKRMILKIRSKRPMTTQNWIFLHYMMAQEGFGSK